MIVKVRFLKICVFDLWLFVKGIGVVLGIGVLVVIILSIVFLDLFNFINVVKLKK